MNKINLFCFPFAGGNKYSYRELEKSANRFFDMITLEYPGRGSRITENLITDIDVLVDDLFQQIINLIDVKSYAFYGHSMGGLIAYLLVRKIVDHGYSLPIHVFVSGASSPSSSSRKRSEIHLLDKKEFVNEIKSYNGCPNEILENEDLLDFIEPILRADFSASERFLYKEHEPLDVPFTVITGTDEDMEVDDIFGWEKETNKSINFKRLPGDHFFIFKHTYKIVEIISYEILKNKEYEKNVPKT